MKKIILLCSIISFLNVYYLKAQEEIRCSSFELLEKQLKSDPDLLLRYKQSEKLIADYIANSHLRQTNDEIQYVIPVVFHLVYNSVADNYISDWQVKSQLDVLNEDFNLDNADTHYVPDVFSSVKANVRIKFCLAKINPSGLPTSGILRDTTNYLGYTQSSADSFKALTIWDRTKYLNIWVLRLAEGGTLGYSTFPISGTALTDGIVITDMAFGRIGNLKSKYCKGRTATHEAGHYFNLLHIWGDDNGACNGTDYCDDTPNQGDSSFGIPVFPNQVSCSNSGDMFMNYMDYTRDSLMDLFTNDQKLRMRASIDTIRTYFSADNGKCNFVTTPQNDIELNILYPFGLINTRVFHPSIRLTNNGSNSIDSCMISYQFFRQELHNLEWTGNLQPGESADVSLPDILDSIETGIFIAYAKYIDENIFEADTINNFDSRSFVVDPGAEFPKIPDGVYVWNNPSSGFYLLKFDSLIAKDFEITVFNLLGQSVNFKYENNSLNTIDLDLLNAVEGFYLVRVKNGEADKARKLLKLPSN